MPKPEFVSLWPHDGKRPAAVDKSKYYILMQQ